MGRKLSRSQDAACVMLMLPMRSLGVSLAILLTAAGLAAPNASAVLLEEVGSFERPTYVTSDPHDPNRLFVVEQAGRIQLVEGGNATTFLDIRHLVHELRATGDYGTFSIAFSPNFAEDDLFYVTYSGVDDPATDPEDESGDWHLDEFRADGDTAVPASRRPVLTIDFQPTPGGAHGHFGGQLQFGPDGHLYASVGDGLPQGDPNGNAQNLGLLFGKILRIDPQGSAPGEYAVPDDNPFTDTPGCTDGCDEIWSYGFRHPWRFAFDRLTGDLVIGDVGMHTWEEVDFDTAPEPAKGANFGWNCREGAHDYTGPPGSPSPECPARVGTFTEPVFEYPHDPACSVTGGYVVRDPALEDLYGRYLYSDFCVGELRSLELGLPLATGDRSEGLSVPRPTSFGEDAVGRVYVASFDGAVYRLEAPELTVSAGGTGTGTISGTGISCPGDCAERYADGALVTLNATPTGGSRFDGWGGDCSGIGSCQLTMDAHKAVSAAFTAQPAGADPLLPGPGPSNDFELAKVKRDAKKGIAFLIVFFPGPGEVGLEGKGLRTIGLDSAAARSSRAVAGGRGKLKVAPAKKGKRAREIRRALERKGRAQVGLGVTYVPKGGLPATQSMKLKLKKR